MRLILPAFGRRVLLPSVLGLTDGILTAVTLAAGSLVAPGGRPMSAHLAIQIAVAALTSSAFVFYVAQYSHLRGELVRLERQLTFTDHGRFAASRLGRSVALEALFAAAVSSGASPDQREGVSRVLLSQCEERVFSNSKRHTAANFDMIDRTKARRRCRNK